MLLLDDEVELDAAASEAEAAFAAKLGESGITAVDARLLRRAVVRNRKVARVVSDAIEDGGYSCWDDGVVELHVRRAIVLIDAGALRVEGNRRRPRWSEVRLPVA